MVKGCDGFMGGSTSKFKSQYEQKKKKKEEKKEHFYLLELMNSRNF